MGDKVQFDLGGEFNDRNYKSCFARSVAVNSQCKQTKSLDFRQLQHEEKESGEYKSFNVGNQEAVRLRKNTRCNLDDSRRFSCSNINSNRRNSICFNRIAEIPVETIVNQSKIETLQWQLKEIQKSREMYRAVMKQVVTFLEKTHHSLELLGGRINRKQSVPRSKSEHQIQVENDSSRRHNESSTLNRNSSIDDYLTSKDMSWRQSDSEQPSPEEIPPDKLAKEAFRLFRTAQSLLNTREPDLAPLEDQQFLDQLRKEFPSPDKKTGRATSFSSAMGLKEGEIKISTAFNRKLSLQLSEVRRTSIAKQPFRADSARASVAESEAEFLHDASIGVSQKSKPDKSTSPAAGSISSTEDESGFSSMNSFQEVGLPLVNSTMADEVSPKNALLRSMLHNNQSSDYSSLNFSLDNTSLNFSMEHTSLLDDTLKPNCEKQPVTSKVQAEKNANYDEIKLWQKPSPVALSPISSTPQHKRWHSTPSEDGPGQALKVLWV